MERNGAMIKGIAHVCLKTTCLKKTEQFYCEGLGLEKGFDFLRNGTVVGFYLKAGNGNFLEFFRTDAGVPGTFPIDHLCLEVDSIDETAECLKKAGYAVDAKKMGADHSWQAWTADPDGVRIELHEYTPESCQLTGKECILE